MASLQDLSEVAQPAAQKSDPTTRLVDSSYLILLKKILVFSGIWKSETNHVMNKWLTSFNMIILVTSQLCVLMKLYETDDIEYEHSMFFGIIDSIFLIVQISFVLKRQHFDNIIHALIFPIDLSEIPNSIRSDCVAIINNERALTLKVMKFSIALAVISITGMVLRLAIKFEDSQKLIYPMWLPFQTDSGFSVLRLTLLGFQLTVTVEACIIYIAFLSLWIGVTNTSSGLLQILKLYTRVFSEGCKTPLEQDDSHSGIPTSELQENLKNFVNIHNSVQSVTQDLILLCGTPALCVITVFELAIAVSIFQIVQGVESRDFDKIFYFTIFTGVIMFFSMMYYASGQKVTNYGEELFHSLEDCHWFTQPQNVKNTFYIVQTMAKQGIKIKVGGFVRVNFKTFRKSIETVYGYLNFFMSLKDKK